MNVSSTTSPSAQALDCEGRMARTLSVLFFFSGFPALIYQLVWQRALFRIFGVNIESVTIVVTAFMLGLGLGALAGGALSKHRKLPLLLLLAAIEALTAAFGLVSLSIFEVVGGWVLGAPLPVSAVVTLLLVIVPTMLMGATLPLLVGHLAQRSHSVGSAVGHLYYVNTLGAGAACLAATVALFPWLGMQGSVLVAVALNAAVSVGALAAHFLDRQEDSPSSARRPGAAASSGTAPALPFAMVLFMCGIGGLVSLSYEIFFVRVMSYATGSSPFAFATTLGAFLIGLASGGRLGAEASAAGGCEALMARLMRSLLIATAAGAAFLPILSHSAWLQAGILGVGLIFVYILARQWGLVLPCLAQLGVSADSRVGMRTGLLYMANIVGAASGSVLTGFVLMDWLGLVEMAQLLVTLGLVCALGVSLMSARSRRERVTRGVALLSAGMVGVAILPHASGHLLESLQFKGGPGSERTFSQIIENRSGIVTVDTTGTVYGNGAYDGHFNVDLTNDINGIIRPYALSLFHAAPRDILMIGLASGSWAQVLAHHPEVSTLTIVEINPAYVELVAGRPEVASLLRNPKVKLIADDGRRWLRLSPHRRFDAIVSNTTYHFRANATNLLSIDFMAILKAHLNPGGIVFYNTTDSSRVQRTGCTSFAHGARFLNHVLLSEQPIDWNFGRWRRVLEEYRIDGRRVLDLTRPDQVRGLDMLMGIAPQIDATSGAPTDDWIEPCEHVRRRTAGEALVTDDNMGTEWQSLRSLE